VRTSTLLDRVEWTARSRAPISESIVDGQQVQGGRLQLRAAMDNAELDQFMAERHTRSQVRSCTHKSGSPDQAPLNVRWSPNSGANADIQPLRPRANSRGGTRSRTSVVSLWLCDEQCAEIGVALFVSRSRAGSLRLKMVYDQIAVQAFEVIEFLPRGNLSASQHGNAADRAAFRRRWPQHVHSLNS
jgi:hypothetical protein